ncbi:MAG: hypothetical protein ACTSQ8_24380 [Candidatus Helarchaeota archaeon]
MLKMPERIADRKSPFEIWTETAISLMDYFFNFFLNPTSPIRPVATKSIVDG